MSFTVEPLTASIGAEVSGVDIARVDLDLAEALRKTWLEYKVLVLRDQHVTQDQHVAFGRLFC